MSNVVKTVSVDLDRKRTRNLTLGDCRAFRIATVTDDRPGGISLLRGDLARYDLAEEEWLELLTIMLKKDDPELTVDSLAELLDMSGFKRCGEAFEELLEDFAATGEAGTDKDPIGS
ncbi:MAG: hypothetical protein IIB38_14655, partial [Candidatus Hydrogenedentes bacterium]|nr:hypothetical protein [Candidatus Hydrogenedentota bacterium]